MKPRILLPLFILAALGIIVALPVIFIVLQAIFPLLGEGSLRNPFGTLAATLGESGLRAMLRDTVCLGAGVALASGLLGIVLGTLRGLFRLPGARIWDVLLLLPFLIPPYISALSWTLALEFHGYIYQLTGLNFSALLFSRAGLIAVMALNTFPIVYFAVSRSVSSGAALADVARACGAGPWRALMRVTLPLALPAVGASLLLAFTVAIEEYGVPAALGAPTGIFVLTTAIERRVSDWPVDLSGAATLALILTTMALAAYLLQHLGTAGRDYQTANGRPARQPEHRLGLANLIVQPLFFLVVLVAVAMPVGAMLAAALSRTLGGGLAWDNLTTANFAALVQPSSEALQALLTSLSLAALTALVTVILGFLAAWCVANRAFRGAAAVDALTILPSALPGVVVAIGMILAWNRAFWPVTPYGTVAILLLAYCCLYLPYPVRYARAALAQLGPNQEAAARVHGATVLHALWHIVLPLCRPGLQASALIVFAIASRELVSSLILAPAGVRTVSIFVWNQFEQGSLGHGMAMATVSVCIGAILLLAAQRGRHH